MSREVIIAWDGIGDILRHEERIADVDQLESVLDTIELRSIQNGYIFYVDLWLTHIGIDDPILIQFLVGHPERSSLLWHEDGATMFGVQSNISGLPGKLACRRFGQNEYIEPKFTMIGYAAVRDTLSLYLLLDRRPDTVNWVEAEYDLECALRTRNLLQVHQPLWAANPAVSFVRSEFPRRPVII